MAMNTMKCNHPKPLHFKGLNAFSRQKTDWVYSSLGRGHAANKQLTKC